MGNLRTLYPSFFSDPLTVYSHKAARPLGSWIPPFLGMGFDERLLSVFEHNTQSLGS